MVRDPAGMASPRDGSHRDPKSTIVEGVETRDELATLIELEADLMQGYHFAKPAPPFGTVPAGAFSVE